MKLMCEYLLLGNPQDNDENFRVNVFQCSFLFSIDCVNGEMCGFYIPRLIKRTITTAALVPTGLRLPPAVLEYRSQTVRFTRRRRECTQKYTKNKYVTPRVSTRLRNYLTDCFYPSLNLRL